MRFVKGIGLFFIYPLTMLAIGFYVGVETYRYFYPAQSGLFYEETLGGEGVPDTAGDHPTGTVVLTGDGTEGSGTDMAENGDPKEALAVASSSETLYVGTKYVLEETDIIRKTVVETTWRIPDRYVGMNREQFLTAMKVYESSPPLSELERGFVGLEVLSFSRERVVIQMNYRYVQPSESFYLAVYDNQVVVYLEDKETVYIATEIELSALPEDVQQEIIQMMWVENEKELYSLLETYSS